MNVHPVAQLFPMLSDSELCEMANSIKKEGLLNPCVKQENTPLDGRNRIAACRLAQVEPRFIEYTGDSPVAFIIGANLARRHLDKGQKIALAIEIEPFFAAEAKKRQKDKDMWIANARTEFCKGENQPCFVCGKYKCITHAHHVYPLTKQYDDGTRAARHDFVWLCPNHHTLIHWLMSDALRAKMIHEQPFDEDDVASAEWDILVEIVRKATHAS